MIDKNTKIQYEIMTEKNLNEAGNYVPSFDKLFREAEIGAIAMKWVECQNEMAKMPLKYQGFAFNLVVIVQQKCGHYEILQHPFNEQYENIEEVLQDFAEEGKRRNCTRCICGFKNPQ